MPGRQEKHLDPWPHDGRPRLVHLMPWDLTVGGAQRMLDLWCLHDAPRWDTHILTAGQDGPFAFTGATVHTALDRAKGVALLEALRPDLLVRHDPSGGYGVNPGCPQVWILHCANMLKEPPPTHHIPEVVFTNFDSDDTHEGWRRLPLHVLPLGVDLDAFRPATTAHAGLVCGIVGRLHQDKVPADFVDALRAWQPGPWRIRFVGHGLDTGYQRVVQEKLEHLPWVEFSGDVPPADMPSALRQFDAVLIPTDLIQGETGSYAALEAMATGLPVIARDLVALRYNYGDVPRYARTNHELLAHLRRLNDAEQRSRMGRQGRALAESNHALSNHVTRHSRAFAAALRRQVSILMPVYDTPAAYLAECWESIRTQTFRAWELVLMDDGSTKPETLREIERIATDPRVHLVRRDDNQGIAKTLNAGLKRCRAALVARMDADDIMMPTRLQRQVAYMQAHPDVSVLGTQMQAIDWETQQLWPPTQHPDIVTAEFIEHQRSTSEIWFLNHPTTMFRRQDVLNLGGYPPFRVAQDLGLWLKLHRSGRKMHNLPSVELHYRLHPDQVSTASAVRREEYLQIVAACWNGKSIDVIDSRNM